MDETFTCSIWAVKAGEEDSFLEAFHRFADAATRNFGARKGMILRDTEDPTRFIVIRRWESAESLLSWAESEEMRALGEPVRSLVTGDAAAYIAAKVADLG